MKQKGFTLIELVVVIGIIAILASVVIVALSGGKKEEETDRDFCMRMGRYRSIEQLPAVCEQFFRKNGLSL